MNKTEREVRRAIKPFPTIHLESRGKNGYVLVAPSGRSLSIGSLSASHTDSSRLIAWCRKHA